MSMRELLNVVLDARKVREACIEYARARAALGEEAAIAAVGVPDELIVHVSFTKKRNRKAKEAAGNLLSEIK